MKIQLNKEILDKARQLAVEFTKLNTDKEKHIFKTEDNFEKKRIGFIGELTIENYLTENNILFEKDDCLFRKDKFDLKIKNLTFDIKTTYWQSYKTTNKVFINETQLNNSNIDYYILSVIHMDKLEVLGIIKREDVKKLSLRKDIQSPAFEIEQEDLQSFKRFLKNV